MCRLAAYLGPPLPLRDFLLAPSHSLAMQSWAPREMTEGTVNADGFGVGWYADDGAPATYVHTLPIWSDTNLDALGRSLRAPLWVAQVRSATDPRDVGPANTQPFADEALLFVHNGLLGNFPQRVRPAIRQTLSPAIEADVRGTTDSEYLFAALRQRRCGEPLEATLHGLMAAVADWVGDGHALLNLVVSDGRRLHALRHAIGRPCPSLYYTTDDPHFPRGQAVASEPLTDGGHWQSMPPHHRLTLSPGEAPQLCPL